MRVLWPHCTTKVGEKIDAWEGGRQPAKTWFQDLKEWTKLDMADASQLATDLERWREQISVTPAQTER